MRRLMILGTIILMIIFLSGCETQRSIRDEDQYYHQYNRIIIKDEDYMETGIMYKHDETYDKIVAPMYNEESGYYIFITGKEDIELKQDELDGEYLGSYCLLAYEDEGYDLSNIYDVDEGCELEYEEKDGQRIYRYTNAQGERVTYAFKEKMMTKTINDHQIIYLFDEVDEDYYKDFLSELKTLNGAKENEVKEKAGDFILEQYELLQKAS